MQALSQREVPALQQKVADQEAAEAAAAERLELVHADAAEAQHALQVQPCCSASILRLLVSAVSQSTSPFFGVVQDSFALWLIALALAKG